MKRTFLASMIAALVGVAGCIEGHAGQGFYVGGLGGLNLLSYDTKSEFLEINMKDGFAVGGFAGYKFCNGIRLEGELSFRRNDIKDFKIDSTQFDLQGHTETSTAMANAFYDFDLNSRWTPYVGVGMGYARVQEDMQGVLPFLDELGDWFLADVKYSGKKDSFAWQAIGGVNYALTCDMDVGLDYRYLKTSRDSENHSVCLCLKHHF